ncbi:MAG: hypothetical protein ABIO46_05285 [Chitinophagales bacterium]
MKKLFLINAAFSICIVLALTSCQKEEVVPLNSDASSQNYGDGNIDGGTNSTVYLNDLDTVK